MRTPGRAVTSPLSSRKIRSSSRRTTSSMSAPAGKRNARNQLGHVAVDRGLPIATRERDSMVTVDHEVRLAELDRNDRWKGAVGVGASERAQPVTAERVQRPEVAGERVGATVRSDECVERDLANAQVTTAERLQPPLDVGELEQTAAAPRRHLAHQAPE